MNKVHSITVDYDNGKLIVNGKEINNTASLVCSISQRHCITEMEVRKSIKGR